MRTFSHFDLGHCHGLSRPDCAADGRDDIGRVQWRAKRDVVDRLSVVLGVPFAAYLQMVFRLFLFSQNSFAMRSNILTYNLLAWQ